MNIREYTFEAELSFFISPVLLLVLVSFCHITNSYKYQASSNRHFSLLFIHLQCQLEPADLVSIQPSLAPSLG